jgi:siroheme synthase
VIFVGAGPGDPDLLTLGAIAALADASAVVLDNDRQREILCHPAITLANDAEIITIGLTEAGKLLRPRRAAESFALSREIPSWTTPSPTRLQRAYAVASTSRWCLECRV